MRLATWLGLAVAGWVVAAWAGTAGATTAPIPVRVMIVSMFGPEGQVWRDARELGQMIAVPGLSPDYPEVH
jgi:purine nucleoside permease